MTVNKRLGLLGAAFFTLAVFLRFLVEMATQKQIPLQLLYRPYFLACVAAIPLCAISTFRPKLAFIQPTVFMALAPFSIMNDPTGMFGFGFFLIGVLLLTRLGFYEKQERLRTILSIAYLLLWEILSFLSNKTPIERVLAVLSFMGLAMIILRLIITERVLVYLKEPKERFSLRGKGLSAAETAYILALLAGLNPKEIADEHSVSDSTVRNTLSRAYQKIGVADRSELAVLAERCEVVE